LVNIQNITELSLENVEYCYIAVEPQHHASSSFKVIVPRIMSEVSGNSRTTYNKNIFVNDKSCKPQPSNSLSLQSYITVNRSPQCNLEPVATVKVKGNDIPTHIAVGQRLQCICMNGNYKELKIIDYK